MTTLNKVLIRIPAILVTLISWYLSSQSTLPKAISFFTFDKLIHFLYFGFLAFCWSLWLTPRHWKYKPIRSILYVLLIVGVYGAIDEYHQSFTQGRHMSLLDWLADIAGAFIGSFCALVFLKLYYNYRLKKIIKA